MLAATPDHDTVLMADGGRLVGTVTEESRGNVTIRLLDGTFRHVPGGEVVRIDYADGKIFLGPALASPAPLAGPDPGYSATYTPPAEYTPPPPRGEPAAAEGPPAPPSRGEFWGAVGVGGTFLGGQVEPGVDVDRIFGPQLGISIEGGLPLTLQTGIGMYLDVGAGGAGRDVKAYCSANAVTCRAETWRVGLLLRQAYDLSPRVNAWFWVGTGFAYGRVATPDTGADSEDVLQYQGWEMLRLRTGCDFRASPLVGVGLYAGIGFIRYYRYGDAGGTLALPATSIHSASEVGLRLTFWSPRLP